MECANLQIKIRFMESCELFWEMQYKERIFHSFSEFNYFVQGVYGHKRVPCGYNKVAFEILSPIQWEGRYDYTTPHSWMLEKHCIRYLRYALTNKEITQDQYIENLKVLGLDTMEWVINYGDAI